MALGVALGAFVPGLPAALDSVSVGGTNIVIAAGLILMMYPPLTRVRHEALPEAFADRGVLVLSLVQNWVIGPVLMFVLAVVFLSDRPEYLTGLILIGLARCIAMVIIWNQLARGDNQYVAGPVAFNGVFRLLFFGVYAWFFLSVLPPLVDLEGRAVDVSFATIAAAVLLYLGVPFAAGFLTVQVIITQRGEAGYRQRFLARIAPAMGQAPSQFANGAPASLPRARPVCATDPAGRLSAQTDCRRKPPPRSRRCVASGDLGPPPRASRALRDRRSGWCCAAPA